MYQFEAMDATGLETKGFIEATNEEEASKKLRSKGLFVTKLAIANDSDKPPKLKDYTLSVSTNTLKQVGCLVLAFVLGALFVLMLGE